MKDFSVRLRNLLSQKKMTQLELAQKAGLTQAAVSHYVKGSRLPQVRTLKKLAVALDVSIQDLMGPEGCGEDYLEHAVKLVVDNCNQLTDDQREAILVALAKDSV